MWQTSVYEVKWLDGTDLIDDILYAELHLACVMEEKSDITTRGSVFFLFVDFVPLAITETDRCRLCNLVIKPEDIFSKE